MIVKFFPNQKGGSGASVDYLLNQREAEGTARVLEGDPQITRDIIDNIEFKQKVTVGVLSFEEANISEHLKVKMMKDFEATLFPGMEKDQYNILWVEHTDKGRLELNFVIPKIELTTQKALQPYYHKKDLPRIEMFQKIQNIEHNLTDPRAPEKQRTQELNTIKKEELKHDYKELDIQLHKMVMNKEITNRKELVSTLRESGIEVTREGKDSLSIKLPESKKAVKHKGGIYSEEFRSIESIREIVGAEQRKSDKYIERDSQAELSELRERLTRYNEQKSGELTKRYERGAERSIETSREEIEISSNRTQRETERIRSTNDVVRENKADRNNSRDNNSRDDDNIHANENRREQRDNSGNKSIQDIQERDGGEYDYVQLKLREIREIQKQQRDIPNPNKSNNKEQGVTNDSTRTTTETTTREYEREQRKSYEETRKSRIDLSKQLTDISNELRKKSLEDSKELRTISTEFRDELQRRVTEVINNRNRTTEEVNKQSEHSLQTAEELTRGATKNNGIINKFTEFGRSLRTYYENTREEVRQKLNDTRERFNNFFENKNSKSQALVNDFYLIKQKFETENITVLEAKLFENKVDSHIQERVLKREQNQSQGMSMS